MQYFVFNSGKLSDLADGFALVVGDLDPQVLFALVVSPTFFNKAFKRAFFFHALGACRFSGHDISVCRDVL